MRKKKLGDGETNREGRRGLALVCALALGTSAFPGCLNPRPEELPSSALESTAPDGDIMRESAPGDLNAPSPAGTEPAPEEPVNSITSAEDEPMPPASLVPPASAAGAPPPNDAGVAADAGSEPDAGAN